MTSKDIKHYIILLLIVFFSYAHIVSANVVIKEVNLDPAGERFIKLFNDSDLSQDLTKWSIKRKSSGGIEYPLVASTRFEGKIIEGNSYFLIVNESTYTGGLNPDATWAKSYTFSDKNTISLYNQNNELINDFVVSKNISNDDDLSDSDTSISSNSSDDSSGGSSVSNSSKKEEIEILRITTKIISPKIAVAGIPFKLDSLTNTNRGKTYMVGKFIWNFGDGNKMEVNKVAPFDYIYDYPGEYAMSLSYFDNSFTEVPDAVSRVVIKVVVSDIYINSVGSYTDPYIELENKSSYDMDLSNWIINGVNHNFVIPKGTIILKGNKLKLSPRITLFNGEDIKYVNIINPNKEIIATYPIKKKTSTQNKYSTVGNISSDLNIGNDKNNDYSEKNSDVIDLNNLEASAGKTKIDLSNSVYPFIGLLVIIGLGIVSFLFMKKKKDIEDYTEKEIRAEDMKIIE